MASCLGQQIGHEHLGTKPAQLTASSKLLTGTSGETVLTAVPLLRRVSYIHAAGSCSLWNAA